MLFAQNDVAESIRTIMLFYPRFFVLWMSATGCAIGSFLNVVIFRLPVGQNIVYPPSRCPKCEKLIKGFDNIPVLSWMLLGGRCRNCKRAISARYPIVEAIVGVAFALFALSTTAAVRGSTEPFSWIPLARCLYHSALFSCLLAMAFIHYDQKRIPRSLVFFSIFCSIVPPVLAPDLRFEWGIPSWDSPLMVSVARCLCGFMAGALAGFTVQSIQPGRPVKREQNALCVWAVAGSYLGWPSILITCAIAIMSDLVVNRLFQAIQRYTLFLPVLASLGFSVVSMYQKVDIWKTTPSETRNFAMIGAAIIIILSLLAKRNRHGHHRTT